jgi:flagellar motility protein MotE (MotC chaperone)
MIPLPFLRRRRKEEHVRDAAVASELARARAATRASTERAERDLAEQQRRLTDAEDLRAVIRRLHTRNHVADDISRLVRGVADRREGG